jgi:hypothetical protein
MRLWLLVNSWAIYSTDSSFSSGTFDRIFHYLVSVPSLRLTYIHNTLGLAVPRIPGRFPEPNIKTFF